MQLSPDVGLQSTKTLHTKPAPGLQPALQPLPSPFVAVITGASRGIGADTAKAFAQAGATGIILTVRMAASLEGSIGHAGT